MDAATFIDQVLTPIAGGIGAMIGMRLYQKRNVDQAGTGWKMPMMVGVAVAILLFAFKMFARAQG